MTTAKNVNYAASHTPGAGGAHPQVSRLRAGSLGDSTWVSAAHHVGVHVPDWRNAVLDVHIPLSELNTLVIVTGGTITATRRTSALVMPVTLSRDSIISGHSGTTRRGTRAGSQVISSHFFIEKERGFGVGYARHNKAASIISCGNSGQNGENEGLDKKLHVRKGGK